MCEAQLASDNANTVNMQNIQCQLTVSRGQFLVVCKIPLLARDDKVSCIQSFWPISGE